jgi:hypothetical protein
MSLCIATNCTEQSPWEADTYSDIKEIHRILRNLKLHDLVLNNQPLISVMRHTNLIYALPSYFCNISLSIVFQLCLGLPSWHSYFSFTHQNLTYNSLLPHKCHMPHPKYFSWFDNPRNIRWIQIVKLISMQFLPVPRYQLPLVPRYCFSTLCSNILSLRSSSSVREKVSYPQKRKYSFIS